MFPYEGKEFVFRLVHVANLAQLLKPLHRDWIIAGVLSTRPKGGRRLVIRFVQFERQIIADEYKPPERPVVSDCPGRYAKRKNEQAEHCAPHRGTSQWI